MEPDIGSRKARRARRKGKTVYRQSVKVRRCTDSQCRQCTYTSSHWTVDTDNTLAWKKSFFIIITYKPTILVPCSRIFTIMM